MSEDEEKLEQLEATAASLMEKKEGLNRQLERWRMKRDRLNESVKSLRAEALVERDERDQLNQQVAEIKKRVEELYLTRDVKRRRLEQLDKELVDGRGRLPQRRELEHELRRIEWDLSTTPTLEMKEREDSLVDRASEIRRALDEHAEVDSQEDKRLISVADLKAVEVEVRRSRDKMKALHEVSQEHHERMIQLYRKADEERERANAAHESFLEGISSVKDVNDNLDKVMDEVRKIRQKLREEGRQQAKKREKTIDERKKELVSEAKRRLEAGEKLSLEELKLIYGEEGRTPN